MSATLVAGCAAPEGATEPLRSEVANQPVSLDEASALDGVLAANDALGAAMLSSSDATNAVASPFGAYVALSMLAEGARGDTAAAFEAALGAAGADRTASVSALREALLAYDGDPTLAAADQLPAAPLLHLADRVVLDDELDVEPDFLAALARGYDAGVDTTDLGVDAAKAVLDEWVNRETGGLVRSSAITPHPDLRVVLQDAIVLAARWRVRFEPSDTTPAAFATGTDMVDVDTLHGTAEADWTAHDVDGWTSVRLPYVEGFVADLVLPPAGTDPADVSLDVLGGLRTGAEATDLAQGRPIGVAVPVLDLEPGPLDLLLALDAVGIGELSRLSDLPDLGGITTTENLVLAQAAQQARLTLDEGGTVAAAVTELAADSTAAQVRPADAFVVTFDRPFLLRVADAETGLTLFLAAVRDPSAG